MQGFGLARIGRDVELKYTPGGDAVASIALAFDYGKKVDGKKSTQWVNGSLWGKRAEALAPYLLKGQQVVVSMEDIHIRTWDRPEGGQGFAMEGRVSSIEFAGSSQQRSLEPARATPAPTPAPAARPTPPVDFNDFDDDPIPF